MSTPQVSSSTGQPSSVPVEKTMSQAQSSTQASVRSHSPEPEKEPIPAGANAEKAAVVETAKPPGGGIQQPFPLSKVRFVLVFLSLMLCVFLFALDQLIVATAIPSITNQFHSLEEVSWIANGFFLTLLAFNLAFAQWIQIFPAKHVMLFAVTVFELGSLICGVAPSMPVLILGRCIAGLGGTGIFNAALMIITEITDFQQRARLFGLIGVNFAIASVIGPLIGGAFSEYVTWRWAFYINLPIGGIALFFLAILVETHHPYGRGATYTGYGWHMIGQLAQCDWLGMLFVLGWGACFILAFQWGGVERPWNSGSVIATLVLIGALPILFFTWEWYMGPKALLPLNLLARRQIAGAAIVACFSFATFIMDVYYLAEMYQAVYNVSATLSGIYLLPLICVNVIVLIATGRIIARTGLAYPIILVGPILMCIGSGLLYSIKSTDSKSYPLGYQVLIGLGMGCVLQNTIVAAQYEFRAQPRLISIGTGVVTFFGFVGRVVGISLGGSIFANRLQTYLKEYAPDLPSGLAKLVQSNADAVFHNVPEQYRAMVLKAYVRGLDDAFIIGVPAAGIALFGALIMIRQRYEFARPPPPAAAQPKEKDAEAQQPVDALPDLEAGESLGPAPVNEKQ